MELSFQDKYIKFICKKEGEREMTKKEKAVFDKIYDAGMSAYMQYVMKRDTAIPADVLERACVLTELREALFLKDDMEQGA